MFNMKSLKVKYTNRNLNASSRRNEIMPFQNKTWMKLGNHNINLELNECTTFFFL